MVESLASISLVPQYIGMQRGSQILVLIVEIPPGGFRAVFGK